MTTINSSSQLWDRLGEVIVEVLSTLMTGWLPTRPGDRIRGRLYQLILPQIGESPRIGRNLMMHRAHRIKIGRQAEVGHSVCCDAATEIVVGDRVKLGDNVMLAGAGHTGRIVVHDDVRLDRGVDIKAHDDGHIEIGTGTYIGPYACLAGPGHIHIGRNCLIASHAGVYANNHNFGDITRPINKQGVTCKGIQIEDDCWLGSGVKILDGVCVGRGSVVGAGAVVTRDIPPYSVAVGVPAQVIARRDAKAAPTALSEMSASGVG